LSENLLDLIPSSFSEGRGQKWVTEEMPRLLDVEYVDKDLIAIDLFGNEADIQIQMRLSKFIKLMEDRGIPIRQFLGESAEVA